MISKARIQVVLFIAFNFLFHYSLLGQGIEEASLEGSLFDYEVDESKKISKLIAKRIDYNKKNKESISYKILLYRGTEKEAYQIKQRMLALFPEHKAHVKYDAPPYWETQSGDFYTRIQADKALIEIKKKMGDAIFVFEQKN